MGATGGDSATRVEAAVDPRRQRSAGTLKAAELAWCRRHGILLAYDPVQLGWVTLACEDDIDSAAESAAVEEPAGRLRLRPWRADEVGTFVALLDNPKIWEHLPEDYPAPLTEALACDLIAISNAAPHHEVRAVEFDGEVVGQVRLAFDPGASERREGEISYWLGAPWWGRGIGSELVAGFTRANFARRPELSLITARVRTGNPASARVLQKAGYRSEGLAPDDPTTEIWRATRGGTSPRAAPVPAAAETPAGADLASARVRISA